MTFLTVVFLSLWTGPMQQPIVPARQTAPPAGPIDYTVGAQDALKVTVFGEPEISGRHTVDSDGTIDFPWIGRVRVGGLTVRAIEDDLKRLLADGYLRNPQINVEVEQYRSQSIFIMGEVRSPGKYPLSGDMTVLDALAQAGSTTPGAGPDLLIVRPAAGRAGPGPVLPDEDPQSQVRRVSLRELQTGAISHKIPLRDGDTLYVPRAETFFVTGHVRNPGSYVHEYGMTVLQAISVAGGLSDRGSNRRLRIIRNVNGIRVELRVGLSDVVQAGDTVVVPQRFF